ncbi:MAG TPA: hypothetical protein DGN59_12790 [Candidatus Latescibacteria bacterium]|nr:hypothetical protein [Candidatus Latescibacterota bacterium]
MRITISMLAVVFCLARPSLATPDLTMDVLSFNEQGDMVTLPAAALTGLSEATLEIWVRWEQFNNAPVLLFGVKETNVRLHNDKDDNHLEITLRDADGKKHEVRVKDALELNRWHHIAILLGGDKKMRVVLDGKKRDDDGYRGGLEQLPMDSGYYVGRNPAGSGATFRGTVADLRIWNRRLKPAEIVANKDRLFLRDDPALVAYWQLNTIAAGMTASSKGGDATVAGAQLASVPAISRFLVPGELEKEADSFYAEANERMEQGAFIEAYRGFDSALELVPNFRDSEQLLADAVEKGAFPVALYLFKPLPLADEQTTTDEDEGILGRLGRAWADLRVDKEDRNALREDLYTSVAQGLQTATPPYVQFVDQTSFAGGLSSAGLDPLAVTGADALEAAHAAGYPVLLMGRFTQVFTNDTGSKKEKKAYTTKKQSYTNSEGKKKKRRVSKKAYTYKERSKRRTATCTFVFQLLDTATGEVLHGAELKSKSKDSVFYVNWDNFDGVPPGKLYRRMEDGKYTSLDTSHFDTRSLLKGKWELYDSALADIGSQIVAEVAATLSEYEPPSQAVAVAGN